MTAPDDIATVPTTGTIRLPPAPRSLDALGRNHSLPAALAELVDNSIDAGATHVLIRFVQAAGRLTQLMVVDDGAGMDSTAIDVAMTVGGVRDYRSDEIGRFGFGLKAASFSQADVLTVFSRSDSGEAVGRRLVREQAMADFSCELVDRSYAARLLDQEWELPAKATGTIVMWDAVRGFPVEADEAEVDRFLGAEIGRIRRELGLIHHRLLSRGTVKIMVDVEDRVDGLGQRIEVTPLDPFAYPRPGVPGWPHAFDVRSGDAGLRLHAHIWPGRSNLDEFRLDGDVISRQGLYVYFNDRLIQRGGWNGLTHPDKQLSLARVAVDIHGDIPELLSVKPEKNGVEIGPRFTPLVRQARDDDGTSFSEYLEIARGCLKDANRRQRTRVARIPPGSGFHPNLRRAIEREIPPKDGEPISIRWRSMATDDFFEVEREDATLWLNKRYRSALAGGRAGSLNDLPMIKTLLYLLIEEIFAGQNMGPRDKDNLELWQELLTQAAQAELTG